MPAEFWAGLNALITYGIGYYVHAQGEGPAPAVGRGALVPPALPLPLTPISTPVPTPAEGAAAS